MADLLNTDYMHHELVKEKYLPWILGEEPKPLVDEQYRVLVDLLLYDKICFVTGDYTPILLLLRAFGIEMVTELLNSRSIQMLTITSNIGFNDQAREIQTFHIAEKDKITPAALAYAPEEVKLSSFLEFISSLYPMHAQALEQPIKNCSQPLDLGPITIALSEQIIDDFASSKMLSKEYPVTRMTKVLRPKRASAEMHVTRIEDPSMRTHPTDVVQALLRIAHSHINLALGATFGTHVLSSPLFMGILRNRLNNSQSVREQGHDEFRQICSLNQVPDIEATIRQGQLSPSLLFKIRESTDGTAFRNFVDNSVEQGDNAGLASAYTDLLSGRVHREEARLSWFLVKALGVVAGPVISALANKGLNRFSEKGSVIAFTDRLRDMTLSKKKK